MKQKNSFKCLVAMGVLLGTTGAANAEVTWSYDAPTTTLTISGTGDMSDYDDNRGYPQQHTTAPWGTYYSQMTSVVIEQGVTSIGKFAFSGCRGLTSVTIPNSVTFIDNYAFWFCRGLTSVTIGNSVTSIGEQAFNGCSPLTSITIPNSVTSIGERAFNGCDSLTAIDVDAANANYTSVDGVLFNKNKTTLIQCPAKKTGAYTIPSSVDTIDVNAFFNCKGLTSVTIPNSVTSIGFGAFSYCTGLTSVTIPDGVTSIEQSTFSGCSGVTEINIGSGLTTIANIVSSIGPTAINIDAANASLSAVDGVVFNKNKTTIIHYPSGKQGASYTIPSSVDTIGSRAFLGCDSLTSVMLPDGVTSIGEFAFYACRGLTSVTIPGGVTSIERYAFRECSGLTFVTCLATTPPLLGDDNFTVSVDTLYVPASAVGAYANSSWISVFGRIISDAIDATLDDCQAHVAALQADSTTKQGQIATLQAEKAALQSEKGALQSHVSTLQTDSTSKQGQITTLQTEVATLQSQIATLQAQLDECGGTEVRAVNSIPEVYPNPTTGVVYVNNPNGAEIKVHNLSGELLQTTRESRIDLSGEPNGVYLLRIGEQTLKVVKQ